MLKENIKLVASDMDGTLINDLEELPHNFDEMMHLLKAEDVTFVAISGRASFSIKQKLEKDYDNLYVISDNGAIISKGNDILHVNSFPKENFIEIVSTLQSLEGVMVAAGSPRNTFVNMGTSNVDTSLLEEFFTTYSLVDDLLDYADESIVSITVKCATNAADYLKLDSIKNIQKNNTLIQAGEFWLDAIPPQNNKGLALKRLCEILNIDMSNIIAFGDYNNDYEMIKYSGKGFAMEDATDHVKSVADEVIGSNNNNSVVKKIYELFNF